MKKIVYISLPMAGVEDTIWERYEYAKKYIKETPEFEDATIISPINISNFAPGHAISCERTHSYGWYIGRDVERLCDCTDIFMCDVGENSRGCRIEHETAKIMEINRHYMEKK